MPNSRILVSQDNLQPFLFRRVSPEKITALELSHQFAAIDRRDRQLRVELDNGTERVRSPKNTDSRQRKIRLYDQYQGGYRTRFRAFLVTTRSQQRLGYILDNAAELVRNP